MERYNSFNIIHKGLRAALYQTALQLQQTDFIEEDQAEEALGKVKEIVMLFEGHAQVGGEGDAGDPERERAGQRARGTGGTEDDELHPVVSVGRP